MILALAQDSGVQKALADSNVPNTKLIESAVQQIRGTKELTPKPQTQKKKMKI